MNTRAPKQDDFIIQRNGIPHEPNAVIRLVRRKWPADAIANELLMKRDDLAAACRRAMDEEIAAKGKKR